MINSNIDAIQSVFAKQAIVAQNIANLHNYMPIKAPKISANIDLAKQLVNSNFNVIDLKANVAVLKSQNKMLGSLLDLNI